jgi:uncharacterized protein (TIGR00288 family)
VLESVKRKLRKKKMRAAILVDGPNMIRREFNINLGEIKKRIEEFAKVKVAKVFLNQYANEKLIEAVTNQGFEPVITPTDVDVYMAVEATLLIFNPRIDCLVLVTRDADFQPVLTKAKEFGKETVVVTDEPAAAALKNTADKVIMVKE